MYININVYFKRTFIEFILYINHCYVNTPFNIALLHTFRFYISFIFSKWVLREVYKSSNIYIQKNSLLFFFTKYFRNNIHIQCSNVKVLLPFKLLKENSTDFPFEGIFDGKNFVFKKRTNFMIIRTLPEINTKNIKFSMHSS